MNSENAGSLLTQQTRLEIDIANGQARIQKLVTKELEAFSEKNESKPQLSDNYTEIIRMSFDKWMLEERHKANRKTEDDWLIFAVDSQDSYCVFSRVSGPRNNQTRCVVSN